jgi:hypothetical protein
MSETAGRARDRTTLLLVLVLAATCLVAMTSPPAVGGSAVDDAPSRWAGYGIPRTGDAAGGWIGGYRIGAATVFVTTPSKRRNRHGYEEARIVEDHRNGAGAGRTRTARAAWILSKYGGFRDATQAAAVDATVYHLLVGGRWRVTEDRGRARIRRSGHGGSIRRFARIMLRQSAQSAGPYAATVTATGADVGGTVAATVAVTTGSGDPASGLPVSFASPGAEPVAAVTGSDGRALARFAAPQRGWQTVTATVEQVPEHRLHVRSPKRRGEAAAAEGGVKRTLSVSTQAPVRGPQTLSMKSSPDTILVGAKAAVTVTVAGDGSSRTATGTLHGPFAAASAAHCSGPPIGSVSAVVTADGDYALPSLSPTIGGFYVWRVAVDGAATSLPVVACGATTKVKAVAAISVTAVPAQMQAGNVTRAHVSLSGLPAKPAVNVTATLWGPYANEQELRAAGCAGSLLAEVQLTMNGTDAQDMPGVYVTAPGVYAWQASVPPAELREGSRSPCGAPGTLVWVS